MNAHPTNQWIPETRRSAAAQNFSCSLAGAGRLLTGTLLLLLALLAGGRNASAQAITNCFDIICPPAVVTNYICGDSYTPTSYGIIISNSCPNVSYTVNCNPPVGTPLGLGSHPINCVVTANGVVVGQCAFTIVVIKDVTPPTITCPTNMLVRTCPNAAGGCGEVVNYPPPIVSDNSGVVTFFCNPPPGSTFPCGNTVVTCTAVDRCQNSASCTFIISVQLNGQVPTIQCPPDQTITTCSNSAILNYPAPTVSPVTASVTCNPPLGTVLPLGSTAVNCRASNACGQVFCTFKVDVIKVPSPTIQCPTAQLTYTVPCGSNCVPVIYPALVVNNGVLESCNPPSGTCLPVGNQVVFCRATNICGQVAVCEFSINVIQGQGNPPSITCPSNMVVLTCSNCAPVSYAAPVVVNGTFIDCIPASGSCFPLGLNTVICTASNACAATSCSFTVDVRSVPPATILCPTTPVVLTLPCGSNCIPITYTLPAVTGGTLMNCTPAPGTCLSVGNYFIVCRASNSCGQVVGCEFPLHVIQGQGNPPSITCPSDITVNTCSNNCAIVTYPAPNVVNGVLANCTPPSGACFPLGTTTVTCTATNGCGTSTCSFKIVVRQIPPPTIVCPTNPITAAMPCGTNCVPVSYPAPVVNNGVLVGCLPPSGSCLPLGTHVVTCRATNVCGVVDGCEFVINVINSTGNQTPVINCPSNIVVNTCNTGCQIVTYPAPTVFNGVLVGCTPPSGTCFPIGTTIVTCIASNACGTSDCKFTVTVRPIPVVTIQCPSNIVTTACGNGALVLYPAPTITPATAIATVTCNPPSGSFFPLGATTVTCCVVDQCQRTNCCSFTVTVLPGNPCVKPPLNMVLWLPFDEAVGPVAANIVPGALNGGHVNGPVPLLGQYVLNSLSFDGVNDFVRVPNYAGIVLSTSDLSIDAWVRRTTQDQGRRVIVSKVRQSAVALNARGYEYYLNNGIMNLALLGPVAQNYNSGVAVPLDNQWHHVTVTVRRAAGGSVRFYLDGVLVNALAGPITAPIGNNSPLYVGAGTWPAPNSFFRGGIDEVEIFNRVLTPAEIAGLWNAKQAGKCKITCKIPWDKTFPPGVNCITVTAMICNNSAVTVPINWNAYGPLPISPATGTFNLGPFSCTNIPITLCRPTNSFPIGQQLIWNLAVTAGNQCPMICMGSVINPGPIVVTNNPGGPIVIAGTNNVGIVRIGLNGLPPGQPVRIRAIGPDMEPDQVAISLNGLPPGQPVIVGGGGFAAAATDIPLGIRFVQPDAMGDYVLIIETDVDGDGDYDTLESIDVQNPLVPPPTIQIRSTRQGPELFWQDEGDGLGALESAKDVEGPWSEIPGALPGYLLNPTEPMEFFRVAVPITD